MHYFMATHLLTLQFWGWHYSRMQYNVIINVNYSRKWTTRDATLYAAVQYVAKRVLIPVAELWYDNNSKPHNSIENSTQKMKKYINILVKTLTILIYSEIRTNKDQLKRQQGNCICIEHLKEWNMLSTS